MKSFRLDRESVSDVARGWPQLLAGLAIMLALTYLGWSVPVWRIILAIFIGTYFGGIFSGGFQRSLVARYPNARFHRLLSIGLLTATSGVICRMTFPTVQGGFLDIAWILFSFVFILAFVLLNRHDPDVMK